MLNRILSSVFGSKNERDVARIRPIVQVINDLESSLERLSEEELAARTPKFKERVAAGTSLDDLLPEAFATVREAARRVLEMRHFDVQLIGGAVLHQGRIAEMKTGEGKTLVATLPAYLNALTGRGVHVVTVNDYLARRDAEWMGRIYRSLGLSVGVIQHDLDDARRRQAYASDVTYGTNNEFGFDFLRDNMKYSAAEMVQRGHVYAIVDEVDSILVDEARTPLIISGPTDDSPEKYFNVDRVVPQLKREVHYQVDEKHRTATLTEQGIERAEQILGIDNLYDPVHMDLVSQLHNALKAHALFKRDVHYVVKDGMVIIVDEFTGRQMAGRRWSDGLHQAVEAKERVKVERESQTYATVTFQNYFRMYGKLAGMTGTAETEAAEFHKIYKLDVTVIPANRKLIRKGHADIVYRTEREKFSAIVREVTRLWLTGQPVLVGTISIEKSERLSELLGRIRAFYAPRPQYIQDVLLRSAIVPEARTKDLETRLDADAGRKLVERPTRIKELLRDLDLPMTEAAERFRETLENGKVPHVVLNAKYHERESEIVAQAGRIGAVTIATNMAGRGTDILLGGNPEFLARAELGQEVELTDLDGFRAAVAKYREQCRAEHDRVVALGGLFILGSERHESRRIDNQLRGRAGRQGDPGESRFYLSLEDDLMRIFQSERVSTLMQKLGMEEDEPIEHKMVTRAIERAQGKVEEQNFSTRKHLLEYDDVMNKQREAFYKHRREVLDGQGLDDFTMDVAKDLVEIAVREMAGDPRESTGRDAEGLASTMLDLFGIDFGDRLEALRSAPNAPAVEEMLLEAVRQKYQRRHAEVEALSAGLMARWEQDIMLSVADNAWRDHLYSLDHLKEGIGLRGYAQRDPLVEYKRESFVLFERMWSRIDEETTRRIFLFRPVVQSAAAPTVPRPRPPAPRAELTYGAPAEAAGGGGAKPATVKGASRVGRNDPCPCGSGKKYKRCHGTAE